MLGEALLATLGDLAVGLLLASFLFGIAVVAGRLDKSLDRRWDRERMEVEAEPDAEVVRAFSDLPDGALDPAVRAERYGVEYVADRRAA